MAPTAGRASLRAVRRGPRETPANAIVPPEETILAALEEAEEVASELNGPTFVKVRLVVRLPPARCTGIPPLRHTTLLRSRPPRTRLWQSMLPSHVSGGYWLQAPKAMVRHMPRDKESFPMEHDGQVWDVVWLPRPGGSGGMSGGWRTFAIDMVVPLL